jgi:ATP-dependent HslUV protease ATP-binding subunit HslU
MLQEGKLEDREVDIDVAESAVVGVPLFGASGMDSMGINLSEVLGGMLPKKSRKRRMKVSEARRILTAEEAEKLLDAEALSREALEKAQEDGIIFLDEIDKVVAKGGSSGGSPDVSREGVQRDLLPIVEGSTVQTRYGPVKTDHVLFIAAGAFSGVKPSDLIPELQGRFPIRVELQPLSWENLREILIEPENSLLKQYTALIKTEGTELRFADDATREIAVLASKMNAEMEDIGARRLHTMLEQLLEEISFSVCDESRPLIEIDANFVHDKLNTLVENRDIRRYLL